MISQNELDQFKKIYFEDYGIELDNQEALRIATQLLTLAKIALGIPRD